MSTNPAAPESLSDIQESNSQCRSARLFLCARCRVQTKICSYCDRGQVYCNDCAAPARQEAQREASERYQLSRQGRFKHAARQRRYRERKRLENEKVTHQGCSNSIDVLQPQSSLLPENEAVNQRALIKDKEVIIICDCCNKGCSPFLRRDFLVPGYTPPATNVQSRKAQVVP